MILPSVVRSNFFDLYFREQRSIYRMPGIAVAFDLAPSPVEGCAFAIQVYTSRRPLDHEADEIDQLARAIMAQHNLTFRKVS